MSLDRQKEDIKRFSLLKQDILSDARIAIMKEDLQDSYVQATNYHLELIAKKPSATSTDSVSEYFTNEVMDEIRELYFTYWSMLEDSIKKLKKGESESFNQSILQGLQTGFRGDFKLPDLKIPKFPGNYRDWKRFFGLFIANVHEDTSYSAVQKLSYLQNYLVDDASDIIKHLDLVASNYPVALEILKKR